MFPSLCAFGQRTHIVAFVSKVFQAEDGTEAYKQIEDCITRSYSLQRSAFVHGAVLRHAEYQQQGMTAAPTPDAPYSEALLYTHDLYAMDYIARKAL
jgi:hypothetical protein